MAANVMSVEDVKSWLSEVGFERYCQTFVGMLTYLYLFYTVISGSLFS